MSRLKNVAMIQIIDTRIINIKRFKMVSTKCCNLYYLIVHYIDIMFFMIMATGIPLMQLEYFYMA